MAVTNLGRVVPLYKGAYSAAAQYTMNDIVAYSGKVYWHTGSTPTTGVAPTDTTVWTLMVESGALPSTNNLIAGDGSGGSADSGLDPALIAYAGAAQTLTDGQKSQARTNIGAVSGSDLNFVTPEMFGAAGDGETDDTDAIQAAIDNGSIVTFTKRYCVKTIKEDESDPNGGIIINTPHTLIFSEASEIIAIPNESEKYSMFSVYADTVFHGGTLIGDRHLTHGQYGHLVRVMATDTSVRAEFYGVNFRDAHGDGIYVNSPNADVRVVNCEFRQTRRTGMALVQVDHAEIYDSVFADIVGATATMGSGIDIEANYDHEHIGDIVISNCKFSGCPTGGISNGEKVRSNIRIEDCKFDDAGGSSKTNFANQNVDIRNTHFTELRLSRGSKVQLCDCELDRVISDDDCELTADNCKILIFKFGTEAVGYSSRNVRFNNCRFEMVSETCSFYNANPVFIGCEFVGMFDTATTYTHVIARYCNVLLSGCRLKYRNIYNVFATTGYPGNYKIENCSVEMYGGNRTDRNRLLKSYGGKVLLSQNTFTMHDAGSDGVYGAVVFGEENHAVGVYAYNNITTFSPGDGANAFSGEYATLIADVNNEDGAEINSSVTATEYVPVKFVNTRRGMFPTTLNLNGETCEVDDSINMILKYITGRTTAGDTLQFSAVCGIRISGLNLWDESWEAGSYQSSSGNKSTDNSRIRSAGKIPVTAGESYGILHPSSSVIYTWNGDDYVGTLSGGAVHTMDGGKWFTVPDGVTDIAFSIGGSSNPITTYGNDICVYYYDASRSVTYRAYHEPLYAEFDAVSESNPTNKNHILKAAGEVADTVKFTVDTVTEGGETYRAIIGTRTRYTNTRPYLSGDEDDPAVVTDGTTTVYPISVPSPKVVFKYRIDSNAKKSELPFDAGGFIDIVGTDASNPNGVDIGAEIPVTRNLDF